MKRSNMNAESLDFMKGKMEAFNCENYTNKLKQARGKNHMQNGTQIFIRLRVETPCSYNHKTRRTYKTR